MIEAKLDLRAASARRSLAGAFAIVAWASTALGSPALAQAPRVVSPFKPIAAPDQTKAIPLNDATLPGGEQWEGAGRPGHTVRIVRNVTVPTLTPVLPDPAKATGAAVIIAPGGAFVELMLSDDDALVAKRLADQGIAAFILKYRTLPTARDPDAFFAAFSAKMAKRMQDQVEHEVPPEAIADGQAAVRLVRSRAAEWGIDPKRVGFMGFSAGAMLALGVGLADDKAARPDFIAPFSGPLGPVAVPPDAPPLFLADALDDPLMVKGKSLSLIEAWQKAGAPMEVHLYETGGHGFTAGATPATALWFDQFVGWMKTRGLMSHAH